MVRGRNQEMDCFESVVYVSKKDGGRAMLVVSPIGLASVVERASRAEAGRQVRRRTGERREREDGVEFGYLKRIGSHGICA